VRQRSAIHEARLAHGVVFTIQGDALESVSSFRYRPLSMFDKDWLVAHHNLKKTRQHWRGYLVFSHKTELIREYEVCSTSPVCFALLLQNVGCYFSSA